MPRTSRLTSSTADAAIFAEYQFPRPGLALGIVAPPTSERTSFEENRGANSWTVVNGEFFYIKNSSGDQSLCPLTTLLDDQIFKRESGQRFGPVSGDANHILNPPADDPVAVGSRLYGQDHILGQRR
jgi:hypothetical protein